MIPKPPLIPLSQVEQFLAHPGARLGKLNDPPGPSFCVEGGTYRGSRFDGIVFTPTSPSSGATRIDIVVANPVSGDLELIEGTEGEGEPSLSEVPSAGKVAEITLVGNSNGKVLVGKSQIKDLRSFHLDALDQSQTYRLLAQARINLGTNLPAVGSFLAGGLLEVMDGKTWHKIKSYPTAKAFGRASATSLSYVDLKFIGSVQDFHLNLVPYNSVLSCVTQNQDNWASASGATWVMLLSDEDGYPKFRVMMGISNAHGDEGDQERVSSFDATAGKFTANDQGAVQIQAWGRS